MNCHTKLLLRYLIVKLLHRFSGNLGFRTLPNYQLCLTKIRPIIVFGVFFADRFIYGDDVDE